MCADVVGGLGVDLLEYVVDYAGFSHSLPFGGDILEHVFSIIYIPIKRRLLLTEGFPELAMLNSIV